MQIPRYFRWGSPARALPTVAVLVLAVLIGRGLAQTTWAFMSPPVSLPRSVTADGESVVRNPGELPRYGQQIAALHLFGEAKRELPKAPVKAAPAAPKRVDLKLVGVLATGSESGIAIIRDDKGKERIFQVGQPLPGGGILKAVEDEFVIVDYDGQEEELSIPRQGIVQPQRRTRSRPGEEPGANEVKLSTRTGPGKWLMEQRGQWLQNPRLVNTVVQISPAMEGGRLIGYRLVPRRDRGLLRLVGVQPSDVILAVNSMPLTDQEQAKMALEALTKSDELELTIRRGTATQTIQVSLQE